MIQAKTHIVELSPEDEYYTNYKLESAWLEIVSKFMEAFPAEDISFISTDSILKISKPIFSFNLPGHLYLKIPFF